MLKTIKFPKNIHALNDQLPKPKYEMKAKTQKSIKII